jgi:hypothetical protein
MKLRSDPRLPAYFSQNATDPWQANHKYPKNSIILDPNGDAQLVTAVAGDTTSGASQPSWSTTVGATTVDNNVTWTNTGLPYGGEDVNTPQVASTISAVDGTRNSPTFRQPFVTYAENQLILAEAYNQTANDAAAVTELNKERAAAGLGAIAATGPALLDAIMTEKYVALFQNVEVWNDYKRTCTPALVVYTGPGSGAINGTIPGRFYYGSNERNTNPNIPPPSTQVATNGFRNRNDPNPC